MKIYIDCIFDRSLINTLLLLVAGGSPFAVIDCRNDILQVVNVFGAFAWCHATPELLNSTY